MILKKRIIPIFLILILSLFPTLPFIESAGYGEENENLGQFTDDFENDNNVSVAVNVINNQTLDCMELNFTSGATENFASYTEVDEDGDLIITVPKIDVSTMRRDAITYVWKDFNPNYFGDFEHRFKINITDLEAGDVSSGGITVFSLMTNSTPNVGVLLQTSNWLGVYLEQNAANDDKFRLRVWERDGGATVFITGQFTIFDVNDPVFITFNRSGATVGLYIYDSESRTNLIESVTGIGNGKTYRYFEPLANWGHVLDPADHYTGYIENLDIGLTGYDDGYFTTEDYLNYTTGNSLALLTNASIPSVTSMTVQFSNDNATWVDNEGNVGSTPVLDGFYAIDLRDLNYSDSFKMFNLSTTNHLITPRLFQSRLITTNGTAGAGPGPTIIQNVTGEWFYYNLTTINVTVGTHDSGDLNSTLDVDGDTYNCSEVVGVPGYVIEFEWTDVDQDSHCLWVTAYIFYDGVSAHTINVDLWNFTSTAWVTIGIIYDMVDFEWVNSSIYDLRMPNDFINSTGAVRGRFYHASAGNINDDIHTDFLKLYAFIPFEDEAIVTEQDFFLIFIAITLSMIVGIVVWLKYEHNNN